MKPSDEVIKRTFDIALAAAGLVLLWPLIAAAWVVASVETRSNGFFFQTRVGRNGRLFRVVKIKTMKPVRGIATNVTTSTDVRITKSGRFFRKTKIDELPQLWNILLGDMSFVGPRPDVPGFADRLEGDDRIVLSVRPGITGPATLKYRDEEEILAGRHDPERYNREVIWPDKVRINKEYIRNWSLAEDIKIIIKTIGGA
ncbi:sugar transferase [Hydrogenimonas urashimensis]|uniref:sugar transferase n=1 Tax=Hydrogenimonas urashimensis TaxID=2740515 RepID=UPI00191605DB|nr:sugar transferase [Hydrogenimonas urashimensis]